MTGGGKKRLALESPSNDAASSADANGGNGGDNGHSAPVSPIDRTLLLSGVGEKTPIQESEERVDTERAMNIFGGADQQARAVVAGTAGNNDHNNQVSEPVDTQRAINISGGAVEQARAAVAGTAGNNGHSNQVEEAEDNPTVVKIIKPIDILPPLSSNRQEVLVTFLALKSDGAEMIVSNQYLKASNPLLLVNYYEQHLQYSPA